MEIPDNLEETVAFVQQIREAFGVTKLVETKRVLSLLVDYIEESSDPILKDTIKEVNPALAAKLITMQRDGKFVYFKNKDIQYYQDLCED